MSKSSLRLAGMGVEMQSDPVREVQDLKEQLEALRCQVSHHMSITFKVILESCKYTYICHVKLEL